MYARATELTASARLSSLYTLARPSVSGCDSPTSHRLCHGSTTRIVRWILYTVEHCHALDPHYHTVVIQQPPGWTLYLDHPLSIVDTGARSLLAIPL